MLLYRSRTNDGAIFALEDKGLDFQRFLDMGLVSVAPMASSYWCGCGGGGSCDVIWIDNLRDGTRRPIVQCEACGIYRIDPEVLRVWSINLIPLLEMVGKSMGFSPPFSEMVPQIVWTLGRKKRRDFFYVRRIYDGEIQAVRSFFAQHTTAIIVAPVRTDLETFNDLGLGNFCVSFDSLASMDEEYQISIGMAPILAELEPVEDESKQQQSKRGNRAANIEKLVAEMKEHYRASRDHYYATGHLLPRPTQGELAKRIGTRQDDVSRCLADPNAMMLKLLWSQAEDIRAVLNS